MNLWMLVRHHHCTMAWLFAKTEDPVYEALRSFSENDMLFSSSENRQLRSWRRFALNGSLLRWYKFQACRDLDGRVRVSLSWEFDYESPAFAARRFDLLRLGYRNWRIRCEAGRDFVNTLLLAPCSLHEVQAAVWQKEGFNVKAWDCSTKLPSFRSCNFAFRSCNHLLIVQDRAKKSPCVEIANLWESFTQRREFQHGTSAEEMFLSCKVHCINPHVLVYRDPGCYPEACLRAHQRAICEGQLRHFFLPHLEHPSLTF